MKKARINNIELKKKKKGFTASRTSDMMEVLIEMDKRNKDKDLYLVGFSLGACITLKFLGEIGRDNCSIQKRIKGAGQR